MHILHNIYALEQLYAIIIDSQQSKIADYGYVIALKDRSLYCNKNKWVPGNTRFVSHA